MKTFMKVKMEYDLANLLALNIIQFEITFSRKPNKLVFQCDIPHQWIAQRQFDPVSEYCGGVGCHILCL